MLFRLLLLILDFKNSLKSGTVDLFVKFRPEEELMAGSALYSDCTECCDEAPQ